ncbi:MAG: hypothetical protein ABJ092_10575 [Gillisia sp.]
MDIMIYITAALLIVSKFLYCYTTRVRIGGNIDLENNQLAHRIMKAISINETIWLFFLIAVVIIGLSTFLLFRMNAGFLYQLAFVIIGLLITLVQFAVAHNNYYRKGNMITGFLLNLTRKIKF